MRTRSLFDLRVFRGTAVEGKDRQETNRSEDDQESQFWGTLIIEGLPESRQNLRSDPGPFWYYHELTTLIPRD